MFATALLCFVIAFMFYAMFLTVGQIGKEREAITPNLAARVLFLVSVVVGALLYVYLNTDPGSARLALLPTAFLLGASVTRVILKTGQPRKPLTSGHALMSIIFALTAIGSLIYSGLAR
jgi:hypothetical protein